MKEGPHFGLVLDLYLIPKMWFYGDLYSKTLINDKLLFEHEVGMLKRDHNFCCERQNEKTFWLKFAILRLY